MSNATGAHVNISSYAKEEHEGDSGRKRVATNIDGNTVSYEDANFTSADSPAVLDVATDLGRHGSRGYITNDGPGDILVEFSFDGTTYGGQHTLRGEDVLTLDDLKIRKIRITHVDNSSYRALVG